MTRRSFPFSLRITLATFTGSIFTPATWDTIGTAENSPRDATKYSGPRESGTQLLYLKSDRGTRLVHPAVGYSDRSVPAVLLDTDTRTRTHAHPRTHARTHTHTVTLSQ